MSSLWYFMWGLPNWPVIRPATSSLFSRFTRVRRFSILVDNAHQNNSVYCECWVLKDIFPKRQFRVKDPFDAHDTLLSIEDPRRWRTVRTGGHSIFQNYGRNEISYFLLSISAFLAGRVPYRWPEVDGRSVKCYNLDYSRVKEGQSLPNNSGGRENLEVISFLQEVIQLLQISLILAVYRPAEESRSSLSNGFKGLPIWGGLGFSM